MTNHDDLGVEYLGRFPRETVIEVAADLGLDPRDVVMETSAPCQVHNKHIPASHLNERHHVWPRGEGGPDIPDNIVVVCATGHNNIHQLIKLYKAYRGAVPYNELRAFATGERALGKLGYERITRGAM